MSAETDSEPGVSSLGPVQRHKTVGVGILGVCLVSARRLRLDPFSDRRQSLRRVESDGREHHEADAKNAYAYSL